jgi:hypothetical protein
MGTLFEIPNDDPIALFIGKITYDPIKAYQQFVSKPTDGHQMHHGP